MSASARMAFIVGAPRSGTTLLGDMLGLHADICSVYEPYYIWHYLARDQSTDFIPPESIGPKEAEWIRGEFGRLSTAGGKSVIVDKLPTHSFNLPVLHEVFPDARFIHLLRDGRDVTLSIKKKWNDRRAMVEGRDYMQLLREARYTLFAPPIWRHRFLLLRHEMRTRFSLRPSRFLTKGIWNGKVGWGPRFKGWECELEAGPLIRFQALQWLRCVEQIQRDLPSIPADRVMEVRYENLVDGGCERAIERILGFLGLETSEEFRRALPAIQIGNTRKWSREFSADEIAHLRQILAEKLIELGYESSAEWESDRATADARS